MFYNQFSSLQSWFLPIDSTLARNIPLMESDITDYLRKMEVYLRIQPYINENGDISSKNPGISTNYSIYRFFDKSKRID
ncbi:hypothetical protein [Peribacillus sp. NPDC060253]|uniref:hypothetical protein n=1 Tax=Peribacillus sp. NPDC060253 TaxID=3347084 RepID=UPI0036628B60